MKFILNKNYKWQLTEATNEEYEQLCLLLTRRAKNYRFHPLVKKKLWDGNICLFKSNELGLGLYSFVESKMKDFGFYVEFEGKEILERGIDFEDFQNFVKKLFKNNKIQPYDFQVYAAYKILTNAISRVEIATSGGKTVISYIIFAYLVSRKIVTKERPFLLVVPKLQLLGQALNDFKEYSNGKIEGGIIGNGFDTSEGKYFSVGTYQTLSKKDAEFLRKFSVVGVDEAHQTKAVSIKNILDFINNENLYMRYGVTGTFAEGENSLEELTYIEYLGEIKEKISPSFLIENSYATKVKINMVLIDYLNDEKKRDLRLIRIDPNIDGAKSLNMEQGIIKMSERRIEFITKLSFKLEENTLILFSDIKGQYGLNIVKKIKELLKNTDRNVYYIDGSVSLESRLEICERMEKDKGAILVASYGTLAVGVSIKNLHNMILAESLKSEILIKQAIGRLMRLFNSKTFATVYDIVDDLSYSFDSISYVIGGIKNIKKLANHSLTQARERYLYYITDEHEVKIIRKELL